MNSSHPSGIAKYNEPCLRHGSKIFKDFNNLIQYLYAYIMLNGGIIMENEKAVIAEEKDEAVDIEIEVIDLKEKTTVKKKKRFGLYDVFRYAVMLASLCMFSYASYELTLIYINAQETKAVSEYVEDMFFVDVEDMDEEYYNELGEVIVFENDGDGKAFVWNYNKSKQFNPHIQGYIRQTTSPYIDNPIVQHPDNNDYYLRRRPDHSQSTVGSIFIDYRIKEGLNAKNCIIYGHNIGPWLDCVMFGSLKFYYNDQNYGLQNPTMEIYIGNKHYRYYVYALFKVPAIGSGVYRWSFEDDEAFMEYVNKWKAQTVYTFPEAPEVTKDSHIITLSTCTTEESNRLIMQLVRGEEIFDVPVK